MNDFNPWWTVKLDVASAYYEWVMGQPDKMRGTFLPFQAGWEAAKKEKDDDV